MSLEISPFDQFEEILFAIPRDEEDSLFHMGVMQGITRETNKTDFYKAVSNMIDELDADHPLYTKLLLLRNDLI